MKDLKPNIATASKIIKLDATDSTNSYLKERVKETGFQDKLVVLAYEQRKGRGQMGNTWSSVEGQSLTFSILKGFDGLSTERQFAISMATSLAIKEALESLNVPDISIKWPNDILSGSKKVGGILIENVLERYSIKYSIIGVGMNLNQSHFSNLPKATSLKIATGNHFDLDKTFRELVERILKRLQSVSDTSFVTIQQEYESSLFQKDEISVFKDGEGIHFNGIIKGVSPIGELLVEREERVRSYQLKSLQLLY